MKLSDTVNTFMTVTLSLESKLLKLILNMLNK